MWHDALLIAIAPCQIGQKESYRREHVKRSEKEIIASSVEESNFATSGWNTFLGFIFYTSTPLTCVSLVYCFIFSAYWSHTTEAAPTLLFPLFCSNCPPQSAVKPFFKLLVYHLRAHCRLHRLRCLRLCQWRCHHIAACSPRHHIPPHPLPLFMLELLYL